MCLFLCVCVFGERGEGGGGRDGEVGGGEGVCNCEFFVLVKRGVGCTVRDNVRLNEKS